MSAYEVVVIDDEYEITTPYGEFTDYEDALERKGQALTEIEDDESLRVEIREIK